jgi:mobilome CxxCx(11)CxxC protein
MRTAESDRICKDCSERAFHAYGTAALFQKRSRRYRSLIRALTFMGIIIPLLIGGVVIGFGLQASYLPALLWIAALAGVIQLFFSAWALVNKWDDKLEYSLESSSENFTLSSDFLDLRNLALEPPADFDVRLSTAKAKDDARRASDNRQALTEAELRYAHRAGLRQFQWECVECKKVPHSMESTNCSICGRF